MYLIYVHMTYTHTLLHFMCDEDWDDDDGNDVSATLVIYSRKPSALSRIIAQLPLVVVLVEKVVGLVKKIGC